MVFTWSLANNVKFKFRVKLEVENHGDKMICEDKCLCAEFLHSWCYSFHEQQDLSGSSENFWSATPTRKNPCVSEFWKTQWRSTHWTIIITLVGRMLVGNMILKMIAELVCGLVHVQATSQETNSEVKGSVKENFHFQHRLQTVIRIIIIPSALSQEE